MAAQRESQGSFKLRLLEAYDSRCAVTGERVVPVLDAAHIQPYLGAASNHVQNELLLSADTPPQPAAPSLLAAVIAPSSS